MGNLTKEQIAYTEDLLGVDLSIYQKGNAPTNPDLGGTGGGGVLGANQTVAAKPPGAGGPIAAVPPGGAGSDGTTDNKQRPKGSGWRQVNIILTLNDFDGAPMSGHEIELEFKAPGAETIYAGGPMTGGGLTFSGVWLQPEGIARVIAISTGKAMIAPEGTNSYKLPASGPLKIKGVQQKKEVTVAAKNTEEASQKAGAKGTIGIDYKIVKAEGELSAEDERKQGSEMSYTWVVTIGKASFDLTI